MTTNNSGDFTNLNQAADAQHWVDLMQVMTDLFPVIPDIRQRMAQWITEKPATHILDGGCGPGDTTREVAAHLSKDTQITGIDFSDAMIAYANTQDNPDNVTFQTGDLTNLAFDDNTFDAVRVERVVHHIPDAEKAFAEIFRVLKPSGRLAINEPDFTLTRVFPLPVEIAQEYAQRYSDTNARGDIGSGLHAIATDAGFSVQHHQGNFYIGKHFDRMEATFQAIQLLRDLLAEKNRPDLLEAIETAAKQGTFYWAPASFTVLAEKPN